MPLAPCPFRRIGIDVRALAPPRSGIGVYTREVLRRLVALAPDTDWYCYATKAAALAALPPGRCHPRLGRGPAAAWGSLWFQTGLPQRARRDRLEAFWGPVQVLPLALARRLPSVVTAHDLVFRYHPATMARRNRWVLEALAGRSFHAARMVLADSAATARAVRREFAVPARRLCVVPLAAGEAFRPRDAEAARAALRAHHDVAGDYLLFVGTLEPRKNLAGFLRALALLAARGWAGRAVVVGARGWRLAPVARLVQGHPLADRLYFAGYVPDDELPHWYAGARLLAMPSTYEGFGLPVLEAMACGTPVLCSDDEALCEVAGGAARVVPKGDDRALADALAALWDDAPARAALAAAGRRRAAAFSWDRTARAVLACLARAARGGTGPRGRPGTIPAAGTKNQDSCELLQHDI